MDRVDLMGAVLFGLVGPFMLRCATVQIGVLRYVLIVVGCLFGYLLLGLLLDHLLGVSRLIALLSVGGAFGLSSLVGSIAAKYILPPRALTEPAHVRIMVRRRRGA